MTLFSLYKEHHKPKNRSAACNQVHGHICPSFDSKLMQFVYFLSFQDNRISLVDYVVSYYLHNVDEVNVIL